MKPKAVAVAGVIDDIRRIFQVLTEQSRKIEYETSLTGPQLWVIKILKETSPMKVSDLARRMYLHPATMVGIIDRLESKSLLKRTRSEEDRRVVFIDLTEAGRELEVISPEVVQNLLVNGLGKLTAQELKNISEGLGRVVAILGVQDIAPQFIVPTDGNVPRRRRRINSN